MLCLRISEWGEGPAHPLRISIQQPSPLGTLARRRLCRYTPLKGREEWRGRGKENQRGRKGERQNEEERMPGPCLCRESQLEAVVPARPRWRKVAFPVWEVCLPVQRRGAQLGNCVPPPSVEDHGVSPLFPTSFVSSSRPPFSHSPLTRRPGCSATGQGSS